jgi:hypothetical protein
MSADRVRGAVVVLRAKSETEVPSWLQHDESIERLRDGSYVVPAGLHRIGDMHYAVRAIAESIPGDLSFHDDARGLRWMRFGPIASKPVIKRNGTKAYDLDYETCVSAVGLWVPVAKVTQRQSTQAIESKLTQQRAVEKEQQPEDEAPSEGPQHRNVVVVRGAPKALPKEFVVLMRMQDGTVLGVGPRNRGWVDWLKKNVPLDALRLIRGPVSDVFLKEMLSFEMLDAACRLQGQPLLVMKPS